MDPNSVRFIPNVFDKLLYYIAPADAFAYGNAYQKLGPIACRQVRARLATPKKGMLLLAWPFCMHVREDASNYYKEAEFYDTLRTNVVKNSDGGAVQRKAKAADEMMRRFLAGFELLMLECVENNISLYNNIKVLMLDFHDHGDNPYDQNNSEMSTYRNPFQSAPYQSMASKQWGKAIGAVVARCASKLRHFVFVVGACNELPDEFYTSLKLDCLLVHMQQLETLYVPSVEAYNVAHSNLRARRSCWQALHDLPIEQRLPNLRRIVVRYSSKVSRKPYSSWEGLLRDSAPDVVAIHAAVSSDKVVNIIRTHSSKSELPKFYHCLTASSKQQESLAIEVVEALSGSITYYFGDEENFYRLLNNGISSKTNITFYVQEESKLTLSSDISEICKKINDYICYDKAGKRLPDSQKLIDAVESSLLKVAKYRPQMLSIANDIVAGSGGDGPQMTAKIPARICADSLREIKPETAALLLSTLSCGLSSPLSLTLQLDWYTLLKNLALFTMTTTTPTTSKESVALPWSSMCISQSELKFELTIGNGLQSFIDDDYRRDEKSAELIAQFDDICQKHLSPAGNRYVFPPHFTIHLTIQDMMIMNFLGKKEPDDCMPLILEHYRKFLQQFVHDIVAAGSVTDKLTKTLRADLYANCRKLVIHVNILCALPRGTTSKRNVEPDTRYQRMERLVNDKQFEQELIQFFFKTARTAGATKDVEELQPVMPNLKSISVVRKMIARYHTPPAHATIKTL